MIRVLFLSKNFNNALTLYFLLKIDTYYILFEILHCLDLLVKSVIKKLWTFINQKIFQSLSLIMLQKYRSSRSQMFFKIGVRKTFENFSGKHLCWRLLLIKLQAFIFYRTPPVSASGRALLMFEISPNYHHVMDHRQILHLILRKFNPSKTEAVIIQKPVH